MNVHVVHILAMNLSDFMKRENLTDEAFASKIGIDRSTLNRIRRGAAQPSLAVMIAIAEQTNGAVTPNDFWTRAA